jgi:hypothetical protein
MALGASGQSRIWFVDNSLQSGDGSLAAPFATIAAASAAAAAGDVIYVFRGTGSYRERVMLGERQLLAGHGVTLSAELKERGITAAAGLPDLAAAPVIDGGEGDALTLASGSGVAGIRARSTSGRALVITNADGDVVVRDTTIETASGIAVAIEGGNADVDFARSPVTAATGTALAIRKRSGGTIKFHDGSTVSSSASVRDAFILESNQGELTFADAVRVTTNGARGLVIRSSSRVAITSPESSVTTTKATAVDIADTGISIFLRSVNVDGGGADVKHGISLDNAPGTFRIAGGGVRNIDTRGISVVRSSGVTLQNLVLEKNAVAVKTTPPCATLTAEKTLECGAAIYLAEATDVSLSATRIETTGHTAIFGDVVTNLTLDGVTIEDAGDEPGEHGIAIRNLYGRSVIAGSTIKDSAARQLYIANRAGEGTLEIRKSRFDGGPAPAGQQGVLVELDGDAKFSLAVDDSDFTEHFSDGVSAVASGKSRLESFVYNSRFASTSSAIGLVADGEAQLDYRITGNTIRGATGPAINLHTRSTTGAARGTIADNTIGAAGVAGSGSKCGSCSGIAVLATRGGTLEATVRGNIIRQVDGYGIRVNARGTAAVAVAVTGNTIAEPHGGDVLNAIALQAGALKVDTARLCADVSANRISGAWGIALTGRGSATIALAGMTASGSDTAAVSQFLRVRNSDAAVTAAGAITAAKSCL